MANFNNLNLNSNSQKLIYKLNFKKPTDIQVKVIPKILKKRNVIAQAPTGSGKTHAFLLPSLQLINYDLNEPQLLIVLPTRELAIQINEEVNKIKESLKSVLLIGGTDRNKANDNINTAQIIIATPGRLVDHLANTKFNVSSLQTVVFDEADMLFDLGYDEELSKLLGFINPNIQTLLFSATFSEELQNTFAKFLENPEIIIMQKKSFNKDSITNYLINDKIGKKNEMVTKLLNTINPFVCLIFCSKRTEVDDVFEYLSSQGIKNIVKLHSKLEPRKRRQILLDLRKNRYQYIVASDIAARGIDIDGVSHVINYSLSDEKYFIHRIGRTARFDRSGTTFTFYNVELEETIKKYENKGLEFNNVKFNKDNELIDAGDRQKRKVRMNFDQKIDEDAWNRVRKRTKIKPGYKKKMKNEKDRIKKRMKRDYYKELAKKQRRMNEEKGSKY